MAALLRHSASRVAFDIDVEGAGPPLKYSLELENQMGGFVVGSEALVRTDSQAEPAERVLMNRNQREARIFRRGHDDIIWAASSEPLKLALTGPWAPALTETLERVWKACSEIEVHVPFNVLPRWVGKETGTWRDQAMRAANVIQPASSLDLQGGNLPNAFFALQSDRRQWAETLELIRLGLGDDIEDVSLVPSPEGGSIALSVVYRDIGRIPAFALSDGTLSFLALVAIYRMSPRKRSLLVFDEPDTHLHPRLLRRVTSFFEVLAQSHPVLLTTHSDALLDSLNDPADAVVLCELDEQRSTRLRRVDRDALNQWLEDYRGVGDIRGSGHEESLFVETEE
jgi:hypothetical protein